VINLTLPNILSILSLFIAVAVGTWLKVLTARAFKSIDDRISDVSKRLDGMLGDCNGNRARFDNRMEKYGDERKAINDTIQNLDKELVRLCAVEKVTEKELREQKADRIRSAEVMAHQLESIHKKIDRIDEKFDRLRGQG
jgi:chromosome segregation ATPase